MLALTATIACMVASPGCGGPVLVPLPPPPSRFVLVYERSGGLKSMPRKLKIGPNRVGTMEEARRRPGEGEEAATRFRLPVKTILGLRRALGQAGFAYIPSPGTNPSSCADCFTYSIRYARHQVTFNDVTMPESLGPVLRRLEAIVETHLPFH